MSRWQHPYFTHDVNSAATTITPTEPPTLDERRRRPVVASWVKPPPSSSLDDPDTIPDVSAALVAEIIASLAG